MASEHGAHLDQPLSLRHDFTICRVGALRIRLGSVEADRYFGFKSNFYLVSINK